MTLKSPSRRYFLASLTGIIAAPAIVRADHRLMRVVAPRPQAFLEWPWGRSPAMGAVEALQAMHRINPLDFIEFQRAQATYGLAAMWVGYRDARITYKRLTNDDVLLHQTLAIRWQ